MRSKVWLATYKTWGSGDAWEWEVARDFFSCFLFFILRKDSLPKKKPNHFWGKKKNNDTRQQAVWLFLVPNKVVVKAFTATMWQSQHYLILTWCYSVVEDQGKGEVCLNWSSIWHLNEQKKVLYSCYKAVVTEVIINGIWHREVMGGYLQA